MVRPANQCSALKAIIGFYPKPERIQLDTQLNSLRSGQSEDKHVLQRTRPAHAHTNWLFVSFIITHQAPCLRNTGSYRSLLSNTGTGVMVPLLPHSATHKSDSSSIELNLGERITPQQPVLPAILRHLVDGKMDRTLITTVQTLANTRYKTVHPPMSLLSPP